MNKSTQEKAFSDAIYSHGSEAERTSKKFMRDLVPDGVSLKILDIGCGTGLNAGKLAQHGHSVVGIDLSPVAIEKFRAAGFEGHVMDVSEGLAFPDDSFDLVYASEVIEHLADPDAFLKELNRVAKPGGILLLSTINSAFWPFRLLALMGRTLTEVQHPGHVRFFSKHSLVERCKDAGFHVAQVSARHMYLVLPESIGNALRILLEPLGFQKEFRFATQSYFWGNVPVSVENVK